MRQYVNYSLLVMVAALVLIQGAVLAQDAADTGENEVKIVNSQEGQESADAMEADKAEAEEAAALAEAENKRKKELEEAMRPKPEDKIQSLFFTYWQSRAIDDAKKSKGQGLVRPPTPEELGEEVKPEPGEREIRLGGIVYTDEGDWTIWLNEQRVTPKAIPKEVLDLKVYKEYIEIKWIDEYTNQIFPLRLRAHQRFNIDSRIFLPG